jgi:hypothetical protein
MSFANTIEDQNVSAKKGVRHRLHYVQAYKLLIQPEESSGL